MVYELFRTAFKWSYWNNKEDRFIFNWKNGRLVIGNKEYGQKGLVEQVNDHRKYIEDDKSFKAKLVGGATVVGILYGVLLRYWDKIFS